MANKKKPVKTPLTATTYDLVIDALEQVKTELDRFGVSRSRAAGILIEDAIIERFPEIAEKHGLK